MKAPYPLSEVFAGGDCDGFVLCTVGTCGWGLAAIFLHSAPTLWGTGETHFLFSLEICTRTCFFSKVRQGAQVRGCLGTFVLLQPDLELEWICSSKDEQLSPLVLGLFFTDYITKMVGIWGEGVGGFFSDTNSLVKAKAKEYIFCWKVWGFFYYISSSYFCAIVPFSFKRKRCVLIFVPLSCNEKLRLLFCCSTFWESHVLCAYISRWQNRSKYYHIPASILFMERGSDKTTFSSQIALNTQK